jgi:signal-transduction protein with cAMP-binding, CBS, and nucleotidyltransferase domain
MTQSPNVDRRSSSRGTGAQAASVHLALAIRSMAHDASQMGSEDTEMGKERVLVADVMIVDAIVVSADATLEEADTIMRSTFVTGLPVVDGDGTLVGVIGHAQLAAHRFGQPADSSEGNASKPASAG